VTELDFEWVRTQFPALHHPDSAPWAHLENAGGSYPAVQVVDAMTRLFTAAKVQPYWNFGPSKEAGEAMDRAMQLLPATLHAPCDAVHIGPSTSQNTYVLANALRPTLRAGDEIIVTNQDHEANSGVWRRLTDDAAGGVDGVVLKEWRVDPDTGLLDLAAFGELLSERTRLIAVTHASNLAATINPVAEVARLAHAVGAIVVVDGVSYAPHGAIDVGALDCDVYLYSTYKTYGPHLGVMYVRPDVADRLVPQSHFFNVGYPTKRFTPAGPLHAEIGAAAGVVDYYEAVHAHHFGGWSEKTVETRVAEVFDLFAAHEEALMAPLLAFLTGREDIRLVGAPVADHAVRAPTIAFWSPGRSSEEIYNALIDARVSCGHGNFYAWRLVEALGLDPNDGVVRISMVHYNTLDEVQRAIDALTRVLG
jgi:cysteine desulfurase family protein (TIGR01976 family)